MMHYWPLSVLANNPDMPFGCAGELYAVQHRGADFLSVNTINAINQIAGCMRPSMERPPIDIIQSVGANFRQVYKHRPTEQEFACLERAGIYQADDGFAVLVIDALH